MSHLIALSKEDLLASFVSVDMRHHPVRVEVRELDREGLERVSFRHVVFNSILKLFLRESVTAYSFELVVGNSSR